MLRQLSSASLLCPISVLLASAGSAATPEERGLEIAKSADQANQGFKSERSESEMQLINAQGDVVSRKMSMKILEMPDDGDRSIVTFSWPADVKGTKLLTWAHKSANDDQWLYLPAIKRIKRISSRNKSGSFMGSEFAYEDIAAQELEKFRYRYLEDTKEGGREVWRMERFPVDKSSGYKRQVVWMDKEYLGPIKIEYYDRKDELLKTGEFSGYKQHGKFWRFSKIDMFNHQTKKRSVLTVSKRELGVGFDTADFESDALED